VKKKFSLNHHIQHNILVLFLISITLVSSTSTILPLAYSQGSSGIPKWNQSGEGVTRLSAPSGITVDASSGNVYVADTERIHMFSSNGTFLAAFGQYGDDNGRFSSPEGIALDQEGNVYVADTENNRIQAFSSNGTFLTQWGDYGNDTGRFSSPEGIAVDQEGNVYVADTENNRIQAFSSNGTFLTQWGKFGRSDVELEMRFPEGIAVDQEGNIYVADTLNNRISVIFSGLNNSSPIRNTSFSTEEGEIYGNNTRIKIEPVYEGLNFPRS
jgi:tripartite motif-containing protein 71